MTLPVIPTSKSRSAYLAKSGLTHNVVNLLTLQVNDSKEAHEEEAEYIVLCDSSLSMSRPKLGQSQAGIVLATDAMSQFVSVLPETSRLAIWGFADSPVLYQRFITCSAGNKGDIQTNINNIATFGSTTLLLPALEKALDQFQLSNKPRSRKALVVLTDGETFDAEKDVVKLLHEFSKAGISVFFFGFGLTPEADARLLKFANNNKEYSFSIDTNDQLAPYFMFVMQKTSMAGVLDPVLVIKPEPLAKIQHVEFVQRITTGSQPETLYLVGVERASEPGVFELQLGNMPIKTIYKILVTMEVTLTKVVNPGLYGFATMELQGKVSAGGGMESVSYPLRSVLATATGNPDAEVVTLQTFAETERAKAEAVAAAQAGNMLASNEAMVKARQTVARATAAQQGGLLQGIKAIEAQLAQNNPQGAAQVAARQTQPRPGGLNAAHFQNFMAKHKK